LSGSGSAEGSTRANKNEKKQGNKNTTIEAAENQKKIVLSPKIS
jgi:hypothetical protein